jgi:hypothetical protein
MAIATGVLAPLVGKIVDRAHPRSVVGFGFSVLAIALTWLSIEMTPTTPIWRLLLPFAAIGVGMAFIWSPLAATATRNLPPHLAGAGSGVYNATRQVGAVLGSAGMAAFMTSRISSNLPPMPGGVQPGAGARQLPEFLHEPFAAAMSEATLLPAFIALFGVAAALFLVGFVITPARRTSRLIDNVDDLDDFSDYDDYGDLDELDDGIQLPGARVVERVSLPRHIAALHAAREIEVDEPTELIPIVAPSERQPTHEVRRAARHEDPETEPLTVEIPRVTARMLKTQPTPLSRNGFHIDAGRHFRPVVNRAPAPDVLAKFGISGKSSSRRNRHYREDPDDTDRIGRHSHRDGRR